ncbi:phosphotransferase [Candidatus Poribacteria bacterium]|nr:phosphotransferase [Candidatus Poribacteria bacterium]
MATSSENQTFEQLVQKLVPQSRVLRTWGLAGGSSAAMTALEIEEPDGQTRRMIVRCPNDATLKRNPGAAADEFKLLQITQSLELATPIPYHLDESGGIFETPYLVIEYIDGQPEFVPSNVADYLLQLAVHLAKIHTVDCTDLDLSFLPRKANRCPELCRNGPAALDESPDDIRNTLEAMSPLPQRNPAALLHGDFWPGNVLWRADKLVAVIDWEDAIVGSPLTDFAISRLDIGLIFGIDAMDCFTHHYKSMVSLDYTNLPYWDLCAALRIARLVGTDLAKWVGFFRPFGRQDITEQTIRENYRCFMAQAFERLR